jgi:hypothetical protein
MIPSVSGSRRHGRVSGRIAALNQGCAGGDRRERRDRVTSAGDVRRIQASKSFIPKRPPDISRSVQCADDRDAVGHSPVEDHVSAISKATQRWSQSSRARPSNG